MSSLGKTKINIPRATATLLLRMSYDPNISNFIHDVYTMEAIHKNDLPLLITFSFEIITLVLVLGLNLPWGEGRARTFT